MSEHVTTRMISLSAKIKDRRNRQIDRLTWGEQLADLVLDSVDKEPSVPKPKPAPARKH